MTSGVYAIVNKINGNRYIGSSVNIRSRWRLHLHRLNRIEHHSPHLQAAWNKYGKENFDFVIIEECDKNIVLQREQFYLDSEKPEYNTLAIAGNNAGYKFTDEDIKKMSLMHTGFRHTEESKRKMSEIWSGKPRGIYSQERKEKISKAHKGKSINENQKRGLAIGHYASPSQETIKKISDAQKGYKPTQETIEKLRQAWVRRKARQTEND